MSGEVRVYEAEVIVGLDGGDASGIRAMVLHGKPVTLQIMPGVMVQARPFVDGERVGLELMGDTPLGPVGGVIYTTPRGFENMMTYVEQNPQTLQKAGLLLESVTGHRPLLAR